MDHAQLVHIAWLAQLLEHFALQELLDPQQEVVLQQDQLDVQIVQLEDFVMFQDELLLLAMELVHLAIIALLAQKLIDQQRLDAQLALDVDLDNQQQLSVHQVHIKTKLVKMFVLLVLQGITASLTQQTSR
jgi:hypothetical protein